MNLFKGEVTLDDYQGVGPALLQVNADGLVIRLDTFDYVDTDGDTMTGDLVIDGSAGGVDIILINGAGFTAEGSGSQVVTDVGSVGAPALALSDLNTGFYLKSNNRGGASAGGQDIFEWNAAGGVGFRVFSDIQFDGYPSTRDDGETRRALYPDATGQLRVGDIGPDVTPGSAAFVKNMSMSRNSNTTQNLNQPTLTTVLLTGDPEYVDTDAFTLPGNGTVICNFDGFVKVSYNVRYGTSGARVALQAILFLDGTRVGSVATTGYIRNANGHEQASLSAGTELIRVTNGQAVNVRVQRESTVGTSATQLFAGGGHLLVERV